MGEGGGYFLECYCVPGDRFNLTATLLSPIAEPQLLDYSLEFDMYIQSDEQIKMYQSLYVHPDKNFVYNYASPQVVESPQRGYLELYAVSPAGDDIYARTEFPDQVRIHEVRIEEDELFYTFERSEHAFFDYYIVSAFFMREGEKVQSLVRFHDLSQQPEAGKVTFSLEISEKLKGYERVRVELKRVTQENYRYQLAIKELINVNDDNLTAPAMLPGNITNALGIFTAYTEDVVSIWSDNRKNR